VRHRHELAVRLLAHHALEGGARPAQVAPLHQLEALAQRGRLLAEIAGVVAEELLEGVERGGGISAPESAAREVPLCRSRVGARGIVSDHPGEALGRGTVLSGVEGLLRGGVPPLDVRGARRLGRTLRRGGHLTHLDRRREEPPRLLDGKTTADDPGERATA